MGRLVTRRDVGFLAIWEAIMVPLAVFGPSAGRSGSSPWSRGACSQGCSLGECSVAATRRPQQHAVLVDVTARSAWRWACTSPPTRSSIAGGRGADPARQGPGLHWP